MSGRDFEDVEREEGGEAVRAAFAGARPVVAHDAAEVLPLRTLDMAEAAQIVPSPRAFVLERFIPAREVTLFTGPGGASKGYFGQQLSTCMVAGIPFLGLSVHVGPVLYITGEDDFGELHWRQHHICKRLGVPMETLGDLHLVSLRGNLGNELCTFDAEGRLRPAAMFEKLTEMIRLTGAIHTTLDNVAHLFTGNENDRGQVTQFANLLNRLAAETASSCLLIGHPNKSGDSYSGSTAWLNAVRSQIVLDHLRDSDGVIVDQDARELRLGKANYSRAGEVLQFRWFDHALVRDDDLPIDQRNELAASAQASQDNEVFLACLRLRNEQRRPVSATPCPNYAVTQFEQMAESKRIGKKRLAAALDRLFRIGAIESGFLWRDTSKGRDVSGLRERPQTLPQTAPQTLSPNAPEPEPRTAPNIYSIPNGISGAATEAAAPIEGSYPEILAPGERTDDPVPGWG
jgi:RecA-family ATPase